MRIGKLAARAAALGVLAALVAGVGVAAPAEAAVVKFATCAKLNKVYRHGVGMPGAVDKVRGKTRPVRNFAIDAAVYLANPGRDADHDHVACEKL